MSYSSIAHFRRLGVMVIRRAVLALACAAALVSNTLPAQKEQTPDKKNTPPAKISMIKQSVTVPDFWNGELNTSTVMVAERIDPLPAPLTPLQLVERPYAALGT